MNKFIKSTVLIALLTSSFSINCASVAPAPNALTKHQFLELLLKIGSDFNQKIKTNPDPKDSLHSKSDDAAEWAQSEYKQALEKNSIPRDREHLLFRYDPKRQPIARMRIAATIIATKLPENVSRKLEVGIPYSPKLAESVKSPSERIDKRLKDFTIGDSKGSIRLRLPVNEEGELIFELPFGLKASAPLDEDLKTEIAWEIVMQNMAAELDSCCCSIQ